MRIANALRVLASYQDDLLVEFVFCTEGQTPEDAPPGTQMVIPRASLAQFVASLRASLNGKME